MNCCEISSVNDSLIMRVALGSCTLSVGALVMQSRNSFGLISARSPGIITSGAGLQLCLHRQLSGGLSSWGRMGWSGRQAGEELSMERAKPPGRWICWRSPVNSNTQKFAWACSEQ